MSAVKRKVPSKKKAIKAIAAMIQAHNDRYIFDACISASIEGDDVFLNRVYEFFINNDDDIGQMIDVTDDAEFDALESEYTYPLPDDCSITPRLALQFASSDTIAETLSRYLGMRTYVPDHLIKPLAKTLYSFVNDTLWGAIAISITDEDQTMREIWQAHKTSQAKFYVARSDLSKAA